MSLFDQFLRKSLLQKIPIGSHVTSISSIYIHPLVYNRQEQKKTLKDHQLTTLCIDCIRTVADKLVFEKDFNHFCHNVL